MKKLLALLLSLVLILSLGACGKEESSIDDLAKLPEEETEAPVPEEAPAEPSEPAPEAEPEPEPETPSVSMTTLEQPLFILQYPEADGWIYEEDDLVCDETYAEFKTTNSDAAGSLQSSFYLNIESETAYSFRHTLSSWNVNLEEAFLDGTWETKEISGVPFVVAHVPTLDTAQYYFYRDSASGLSVQIYTDVRDDGAKIETLMAGLTLTLPDNGAADPPMPWDGEPIPMTEELSTTIGSYTLTARRIPFDEPHITFQTFYHDMQVVGDTIHVLSDNHLQEYAYDGSTLTLTRDTPISTTGYNTLSAMPDGTLILGKFSSKLLFYKDGQEQYSLSGVEKFAAAPDGTWGISYFMGGEKALKCILTPEELTSSPMPFPEAHNILEVFIDDGHIYVNGSDTESNYYLWVYDYDGNLQMTLLDDEDHLNTITYIKETDNGYLAIDGTMKKLYLWNKDGSFIGGANLDDVFGTDYPWMAAGDQLEDGSFLLLAHQRRSDESSSELMVFQLSGF